MRKFVINFFLLILTVGIVYILTQYAPEVRQTIHTTKSAVAGASTTSGFEETSFQKNLQKDVQLQLEKVKEQVLDVKVGEVFSFFSRAGKIIDDFHSLQNSLRGSEENDPTQHEKN